MKLTYKDLFGVQEMFGKVWDLPLIPRVFIKLRRLAKAIENELKTFEPERIKLFQRHSQFIVDGKFNPPKIGEDGAEEFAKDYNDVFNVEVDIPYENIDITEVENDIEKSKEKIVGTDGNALLNLLEAFNELNDKQKETPKGDNK